MEVNQEYLRQAIELAVQAKNEGNHPFGALLVIDGKVVLTAKNSVNTDCNPTCHAETNLVQSGIRQLTKVQLAEAMLYTSCEPCAMCAGAIYWAGIRKVIYALSSLELGKMAGEELSISCREIYSRTGEKMDVSGPLLLDEARKPHENFWSQD